MSKSKKTSLARRGFLKGATAGAAARPSGDATRGAKVPRYDQVANDAED